MTKGLGIHMKLILKNKKKSHPKHLKTLTNSEIWRRREKVRFYYKFSKIR